MDPTSDSNETKSNRSAGLLRGLFVVFFSVAVSSGVILDLTGLLKRAELQSINQRFEAREWLKWPQAGISRLNPSAIWQYHEAHEIPRTWWAWSYTLSWLIADNHPEIKHKFVIFNHLLEDEPPPYAVAEHAWMKPLLSWPTSRATMADAVRFLALSGARLILIDFEFPQYKSDDKALAEAIHASATGQLTGNPVPVLFVRSFNRSSNASVVMLQVPSGASGVLDELKRLEPGQDVERRYTGTTTIIADEDQVVRRLACHIRTENGGDFESVVLKAVKAAGEAVPRDVPDIMNIDFAGPPNSALYPVRPFSYLLDPQLKESLAHPQPDSPAVNVKGAIVILGDGVTDVYRTPTTNLGYNSMSGGEVLANAIDTVSRHSWPLRLAGLESLLYVLGSALLGGLLVVALRLLSVKKASSCLRWRNHLFFDLAGIVFVILSSYLIACIAFAYAGLLVPEIVPVVSLSAGIIASQVWERERERMALMRHRIQAAEDKLIMEREIHRAELEKQSAHAQARELLIDRERRRDFVHRLNHDLRAPVSVINWTLMRLRKEGLNAPAAPVKMDRLAQSSDRLTALIDELVATYDDRSPKSEPEEDASFADLNEIVANCCKIQASLAEERRSHLEPVLAEGGAIALGRSIEIARLIDNLIRNALLHNPSGTTVKVVVEADSQGNTVRVSDNGVGIAQEHLEHIFESGYRVEETNKAPGQGLGLHIVKTLIEGMDGTINLESEVGKGSRFEIKLPSARLEEKGSKEAVAS